jgi:hypothetical protein
MSTSIATLGEFAYAIRRSTATAAHHQLLLELAEGLVTDEIGVQDSYPVTVKAVVLAAAARAYFEREGAEQEALDGDLRGVYLTDEEVARLYGSSGQAPQFAFPGTWPYPDPVELPAEEVTS